jgi:hypothetical protein
VHSAGRNKFIIIIVIIIRTSDDFHWQAGQRKAIMVSRAKDDWR